MRVENDSRIQAHFLWLRAVVQAANDVLGPGTVRSGAEATMSLLTFLDRCHCDCDSGRLTAERHVCCSGNCQVWFPNPVYGLSFKRHMSAHCAVDMYVVLHWASVAFTVSTHWQSLCKQPQPWLWLKLHQHQATSDLYLFWWQWTRQQVNPASNETLSLGYRGIHA